MLSRTRSKDPGAAGAIVTRVEMTNDLRSAQGARAPARGRRRRGAPARGGRGPAARLGDAASRGRRSASALRSAPELRFVYDDGLDHMTRVERAPGRDRGGAKAAPSAAEVAYRSRVTYQAPRQAVISRMVKVRVCPSTTKVSRDRCTVQSGFFQPWRLRRRLRHDVPELERDELRRGRGPGDGARARGRPCGRARRRASPSPCPGRRRRAWRASRRAGRGCRVARSASSCAMASSRCLARAVSSSLDVGGNGVVGRGAASDGAGVALRRRAPSAPRVDGAPCSAAAAAAVRRPCSRASATARTRPRASPSASALAGSRQHRERHQVDVEHLVERLISARHASVGRDSSRSLAHAATPPSKTVFGDLLDVDAVPLEDRETFANVPTLSIIRMTSWKRAADDDETLTTLGTVASSMNERMTRTVSVAIASCAWSVAAAMCGVP